jgi:hypothetical protein
MNFGLLLTTKIINHGFGERLMPKREKLSVYTGVIEVKPVRKRFGIPCRQSIGKVQFVIPISGKLTKVFYLQNATERFTTTRARPI